MASSLLEGLAAASGVVDTDITYLVQDPAGTPSDKKLTVGALRTVLGSSTATQVEVDFGTEPITQKTFTVTDTAALSTHRVIAGQAYAAPTGKDVVDNEWDALAVIGGVITDGTVTLTVHSLLGPVVGAFKVNYYLSTLGGAGADKLDKAGGTMTGDLYVNARLNVGAATDLAAVHGIWGTAITRVTQILRMFAAQTADALRIEDSAGGLLAGFKASGAQRFATANTSTSATIGTVVPPTMITGYIVADVNGTTIKIPYYS